MSRSGGRKRSVMEMGHDAFLDIVANLVGILIILVVILGAQSQQAIEEAKSDAVAEASDDQLSTLATQTMRAAAAQSDSNRIESTIQRYGEMLQQRRQQRSVLLDLVSEAEAAWEDAKSKLSETERRRAELTSAKQQLQAKLVSVRGQRQRLENREKPTVAIDHLPTPMAKTVYGDEVHFRLKGNRLSVVPVDGLMKELERDVKLNFASRSEGRRESVVGPVRGYVCRYEFEKERGLTRRGGRVGMATSIRAVRFVFDPLEEPFGQDMQTVLSGRSELDVELAGRNPDRTSVTIWVYPDSYANFRRLKEHLYNKGFATAARPLAMEQKITASPNGSRSAAQ